MNDLFFMVLQNAAGALFLALLVWCVTWAWKSPPVAHVLWMLVLVKLVAPPLVSLDLPWWASSPVATGKVQNAEVSLSAAPLMAVSERLPFSGPKELTGDDIPDSRIEPVRESVAGDQSLSANHADLSTAVHAAWSAIRPFLIWVWVGGIGLFTILATTRIVRFHCLLNGTLPGSQRLQNVTRQLATRMGLKHVPDIRLVDSVSTPLVWCLGLRPNIVLPLRLMGKLDEQQVTMILAHELAHLRRRDHWIRIIELVATVLHWWNPLVWLVRRRLHQVEEQCCDAWVSWLYPDRVHGYAESLLTAAELLPARSQVPLLASAFLNPPTLKERIEVLLNRGFQRSVSRSMALCLALLAAVVIPAGVQSSQAQKNGASSSASSEIKAAEKAAATAAAAAAQAEESGKKPATFQMTGTVTLAVTGEPIAGATVKVIVAGLNPDGTHRIRKGLTDALGRYAIEVPPGNSRAFWLDCPPGYWREATLIEDFVTSTEKPVFRKDYVVRRGPVWRVRAASASSETPPAGFQVSTIKENAFSLAELDASGHGQITIPGSPGECQLQVSERKQQFEPIQPVTLKYDVGFRSDEVTEQVVDPQGPVHRLTDKQGKTATLSGARVTVEKGVATLEFDARPQDPTKLGKVIGVIVDDAGAPVEGAAVGIAMGTRNGGSAMTFLRATSDAAGRFAVERVPIAKGKSDNTVLSVVVTKEGYGGLDSRDVDLPIDAQAPRDVGQVRLGKGRSIRLRVVGPKEEPLAGALVEPTGDYAAMTQAVTTDEKGECEIRNLKRGIQQFDARYGNLMAQTKLMVGGPSAQATLYLKPFNPPAQPVAATKELEPVQSGDSAPEWKVTAWSDGQSRKLGDFRGKVVVLDFWGIWCGPCIQAVPTMKELEKKYQDRGVVFLSIHTAGTPIKQVRELMRQLEWDVPAGLDEGEDINGGTTVQRYGVAGFPNVVVIDRAGKVHFNKDVLGAEAWMKTMKDAAAALSIPFPESEETPFEEVLQGRMRIAGRIYSDAIDAALAAR